LKRKAEEAHKFEATCREPRSRGAKIERPLNPFQTLVIEMVSARVIFLSWVVEEADVKGWFAFFGRALETFKATAEFLQLRV
jgi:hypothetical protein